MELKFCEMRVLCHLEILVRFQKAILHCAKHSSVIKEMALWLDAFDAQRKSGQGSENKNKSKKKNTQLTDLEAHLTLNVVATSRHVVHTTIRVRSSRPTIETFTWCRVKLDPSAQQPKFVLTQMLTILAAPAWVCDWSSASEIYRDLCFDGM